MFERMIEATIKKIQEDGEDIFKPAKVANIFKPAGKKEPRMVAIQNAKQAEIRKRQTYSAVNAASQIATTARGKTCATCSRLMPKGEEYFKVYSYNSDLAVCHYCVKTIADWFKSNPQPEAAAPGSTLAAPEETID